MSRAIKITTEDFLLVVDVQNDFCRGGALEVPRGDEIVPAINRLVRLFHHVGFTQDWHTPDHVSFASMHPGKKPLETIVLPYGEQILWPDHCFAGTHGADLHPDLDSSRAQVVVRKGHHREIDSYSAFFENDHRTSTGLAGYLRDRGMKRLFLAGLAADFCVRFSALDARAAGFDVFVIDDAVRGIDVDGSMEQARLETIQAGVRRLVEQNFVS